MLAKVYKCSNGACPYYYSNITINGGLNIKGIQPEKEIDVLTNSKSLADDYSGEVNLFTPKTLRAGQPTMRFDDTYIHQLFPLNDGSETLSTIIYKEDEVAVAARTGS